MSAPSQNQSPFFLLPAPDKSFVCGVKSRQTLQESHKCNMFHFICVIRENKLFCVKLVSNTSGLCNISAFFHFRIIFYLTESDLIRHIVLSVRELIKFLQPSERLSHSPATEGSVSLEPGVEWTQETNSFSCLVIGDALIRWAGARWRVFTGVSFNRLPRSDQPLDLCTPIVSHWHCDQHLAL